MNANPVLLQKKYARIIEKFAKKYPIEYPEPESTSEMLRQGFKVKEVSVSMNERQGRSYFN